jgi:4-hydroxythreonine-4-phosphate dehydrogenase
MKNKIAITMGEPGGIGPEVIVKALTHSTIRRCCSPVVIGDAAIIRETVRKSKLSFKIRIIHDLKEVKSRENTIEVIDIRSPYTFKKNVPSRGAGRAVVKYITKAVELALNKDVDGMVTAPISKESLSLAGYPWPGHTELLAELTEAREFSMMFVSRKLRVILCTIHMPLKDVPKNITKHNVFKTIRLALNGAELLGIKDPEIAVAGLNPHAGESGVMGGEEIRSIIPAIKAAKKDGIDVSGPYPPDVVFHKAYNGEFDMVVCMYHDQGLIPFKMLAFDTGVNMTVGLPFIRTSPDHGTAFDIAWQNRADPTSMIEAIKLAAKLKNC